MLYGAGEKLGMQGGLHSSVVLRYDYLSDEQVAQFYEYTEDSELTISVCIGKFRLN
jgi:hypothetical protein